MSRSRLLLIGKGAAGLLLLAVILYSADAGKVGDLLVRANPRLFLLACALLSLAVAVNAVRWNSVTEHMGQAIGLRRAMIGNFEAMFFNQVLPTSIGGDAVRGLRAYDAGMAPSWSAASVIIDRAFGLLFVACSLVAAFFIGGSEVVRSTVFQPLVLLSAVVALGAGGGVLAGAWLDAETVPRLFRPVTILTRSFSSIVRSRSGIGLVFGVLIISNTLNIAAFLACVHAIGIDVRWWDAAIILQGMVFFAVVPISIGGWGVREGAAVLLFSGIGIGATAATAVSVLFGLVLTVVGLIGAAVWIASGYDKIQKAGTFATLKNGLRQFTRKPHQ